MNTIKFTKNFNKLHGQTSAELIAVRLIDIALMLPTDFEELYNYDCKANDGSFYPLNKDKTYTQLIFIGNKNIPFATLRNKDKYMDYINMIGNIFSVEVENDTNLLSDVFMQSMINNYSDNDEHSDGSVEKAYEQAEIFLKGWLKSKLEENIWSKHKVPMPFKTQYRRKKDNKYFVFIHETIGDTKIKWVTPTKEVVEKEVCLVRIYVLWAYDISNETVVVNENQLLEEYERIN